MCAKHPRRRSLSPRGQMPFGEWAKNLVKLVNYLLQIHYLHTCIWSINSKDFPLYLLLLREVLKSTPPFISQKPTRILKTDLLLKIPSFATPILISLFSFHRAFCF